MQFLLKYNLGVINLNGMIGYRYSKTSTVDANANDNGKIIHQNDIDLEVDISGFSFLLGFDIEI